MATLQATSLLCSSSTSSFSSKTNRPRSITTRASINIPKHALSSLSLPKLQKRVSNVEEFEFRIGTNNYTQTHPGDTSPLSSYEDSPSHRVVIAKLYAIMDSVADRIEMHKNICEQRNNWNTLLLTSINTITLAATTMVGIAATNSADGTALLSLKMSSTLLYLAATGMLVMMNKIQPSQLAEEQRNATRLCKQLHSQIKTTIAIGNPTTRDVTEAMEKVLAIDKAFPLPLLGKMLEKFPSAVEPAVWWPQQRRKQAKGLGNGMYKNGWSERLEKEMKEIVGVLGKHDKADYIRLGKKALKINKVLAVSGPVLTGLAAVGSVLVGNSSSPTVGALGSILGIVAGGMASVANTLEHGGQVGMVFELYRSNAGIFKEMEEYITANLEEKDVERRENGEILELKVALQLGRSLSGLRDRADKGQYDEEFGSKLF
ncbi:Petal formation-expressed [Heracleum sosnowskyi]|uniref:Petal formation-expressed n=1 Tax=Heracleum sosnowskyi TaxID=360622 RepID=A0AAD8I4J7_9APIA|nr:Petal formation-expressed [Heracleum sosnowskyi]